MSIGLFTDEVIDHFSNPRNAGELENANGIGDAGDPKCGDTMRLYIKVEDDLIKDVRFKICGCVAALASASVTTVLVKGKTVDEALMITNKDISDALADYLSRSCTVPCWAKRQFETPLRITEVKEQFRSKAYDDCTLCNCYFRFNGFLF